VADHQARRHTGVEPGESHVEGRVLLRRTGRRGRDVRTRHFRTAYLGNGEWQFNWKTDNAWKGQCRTLTLRLADGLTVKRADFTFE
jgi:hypothetical protein